MAQPLQAIRIVDFSHVVAGPLATHFLALCGADVIKIEPPKGDALRNYTTVAQERGMSPAFMGINSSKRSVVLDLKSKEGLIAAKKLVAEADIVVENFRPGIMEKLGLGYDTLKTLNPKLIYCAISGFGQSGPLRDHPAIDQIVQSLSGLMSLSGHEGDAAQRIGFPIVDTFTGLLAAFAIQSALIQRMSGGTKTQFIDVAMLDASLVMMLSVVNPMLIANQAHIRTGNRGFSRAPTADTFHTKSGDITIGAVEDLQVQKLLNVLDLSALLNDPKFASRLARVEHADEMTAKLAAALLTDSAQNWEEKLNAVGVPAGRVRNLADAIDCTQVNQRGLFQSVEDENGETHRILNAGFKFLSDGPKPSRAAPSAGEHTNEILAELEMQHKQSSARAHG